jgi:hypothetical protein
MKSWLIRTAFSDKNSALEVEWNTWVVGSTCKDRGGKCHACCEVLSRPSPRMLKTKIKFWTVGFVTKAVPVLTVPLALARYCLSIARFFLFQFIKCMNGRPNMSG